MSKNLLAGKKLLILGGNPETGKLVTVANSMDVYTVVVDPNPHAPAKKFANEHYELDGFDVEGLVALAKQLQVDGVLVGVADILVKPYYEICTRLRVYCYASEGVVDSLTSKDLFKKACAAYGVIDIPSVLVENDIQEASALSQLDLPLMIKPVDNGAGVGMLVCFEQTELVPLVKKSLSYSKKKKVLVEEFMNCEDMFAYYTFKDGEVYLSAIADRITTKSQGGFSSVCTGALYPSKHADVFFETVHPRLVSMFRGIGIQNGVLNLQFFVRNGVFHAYDPGFRLQGEAPHIPIKAINGFDHREMLITFALTGAMGHHDLSAANDFRFRGKAACTLWILLKSGIIGAVEGLDSFRNDSMVVEIIERFKVGDYVSEEMIGNERQVFARLYIVASSIDELYDKVVAMEGQIRVYDDAGKDMIVEWMNPAYIKKR
jgi:biotin carboxylase